MTSFRDAQTAMRAPISLSPLTHEQITRCREVLEAHDAADLVDMLGVSA